MSAAIQSKVMARRITRLCHFTPSRNLVHIATDPQGILSSANLRDDEKAVLNATDLQRSEEPELHRDSPRPYRPAAAGVYRAPTRSSTRLLELASTHTAPGRSQERRN